LFIQSPPTELVNGYVSAKYAPLPMLQLTHNVLHNKLRLALRQFLLEHRLPTPLRRASVE